MPTATMGKCIFVHLAILQHSTVALDTRMLCHSSWTMLMHIRESGNDNIARELLSVLFNILLFKLCRERTTYMQHVHAISIVIYHQ